MTNLLRKIAFPLFVLMLALPFASKAGQATQDRDVSRPGLAIKAQHEATVAESKVEAMTTSPSVEKVEGKHSPNSPESVKQTPQRGPRPKGYADQKTTGMITLGAGAVLLLVGILTNLVRGTTSAFMAMIAGLGTICLVLGALFIIVGVAILIAGA